MYVNKDATEQNKQPHFRGNILIDETIPRGASIGVAGWLNEKGPINHYSLLFQLKKMN